MNHVKPAPKTDRNQPSNFEETIAASVSMPSGVSDRPRLTLRQIRLVLSAVWVAAALIAGVGIGRMINDAVTVSLSTEPPSPIAVAKVTAARTVSLSIGLAQVVPVSDMKVAPFAAITQAQAGNVFTTLSIANLQAANTPSALQPGYSDSVRSQGNIGTSPVR